MGLEKDFYEELYCVTRGQSVPGKFIIHEIDREKGDRISYYNTQSDLLYQEDKWVRAVTLLN